MKKLVLVLFLLAPTAAFAQSSAVVTQFEQVVSAVQGSLNGLISAMAGIVTVDLNLAIADATAQGDTQAAACWKALEALNLQPIPTGAGLAYLKQRLLDAEAQYATINQNCNGPAPLVTKAYDNFVAQAQALNL